MQHLPGQAEAIAAATCTKRLRFVHPSGAEWWRSCLAAVDAAAAAIVEAEAEPAALAAAADKSLRELMDLLARPMAPGQDVLDAIAASSPVRSAIERAGRLLLPMLADAAADLHRRIVTAAALTPPSGATVLRRLVCHLAELYAEAFADRHGAPARASHGSNHGDNLMTSPFRRMLAVLLREHAAIFAERHGFASPIQPASVTEKIIRDALRGRPDAGGWTGR